MPEGERIGRVDQPAPARAAPAAPVASPSGLLAIQRLAGNRAAVALSRQAEPVIRRAWKKRLIDNGEDKWDDDVNGLEWYRRVEAGGTVYWYDWVGDPVAGFEDEFQKEHDATWWANTWAHRAGNWLPEFVDGVAPAPAPAAAVGHDPDTETDEDEDEGEEALDPFGVAAAAEYNGVPQIHSEAAPQYAPTGAFKWSVTMTVAPAQRAMSWIIQEVKVTLQGDGAVTFYEAFPLVAGQTAFRAGDVYRDPGNRGSRGRSTVKGLMQHHTFTGDGSPPDMVAGTAPLADRAWPSSLAKPSFWVDGAGATHDLEVVWDDDAGTSTVTTTPAGGAVVRKASALDFDR